MAEVWRARHRLLARPAAIKLIRPTAAPSILGSEAASRFEREPQAIASLRSPHTVDLFDFGIADDGTFYYVMELLEGLDAERIVNEFGPMPAGRVIHVIHQVCHSLSEAESIKACADFVAWNSSRVTSPVTVHNGLHERLTCKPVA
jgi:serine/threonine protein kinase